MKKTFTLLALPALLLLAACGFTPLYAHHDDDSDVQSAYQDIYIANIPDRSGQILRNDLMDRLYTHGKPDNPRYILELSAIQEHITSLAINITSDATRAELRLTASMRLKEKDTGKILLTRDLLAINSYNILSSQFTTIVSAQAVREDALNDMARQIETNLALYFQRQQSGNTSHDQVIDPSKPAAVPALVPDPAANAATLAPATTTTGTTP